MDFCGSLLASNQKTFPQNYQQLAPENCWLQDILRLPFEASLAYFSGASLLLVLEGALISSCLSERSV